jgi:uncharacterized membrane protein
VRRINLVSVSRLQSYVDASLAIAATLLILNVTVTGGGSLSHSLVHAWPSYAAYAVSFLTIGVIWINHHAILRLIEQPDPLFVIQNLLLLLFVAFLPFPTHVLADALQSGNGAAAAAVFYGISATLMAASFNALWIYASRGGRLLRADGAQPSRQGNHAQLPAGHCLVRDRDGGWALLCLGERQSLRSDHALLRHQRLDVQQRIAPSRRPTACVAFFRDAERSSRCSPHLSRI